MRGVSFTILVFLVLKCSGIHCQSNDLFFENYSSREGLSQNSCYAIAQDQQGFMWFGTQDGLNRYDGSEFKVYLSNSKRGKALPSNHITSLFYDSTTCLLWIGTVRGLCLYEGKSDKVQRLTDYYPFAKLKSDVSVKRIYSYHKNQYWIITQNNGLIYLDAEKEQLDFFFNDDSGLSKVNDMALHQGALIVAVGSQLFRVVNDRSGFHMLRINALLGISDISYLYSFQSQLWVGTYSEGCFRLYLTKDENAKAVPFNPVSSGGIGCFVKDKMGALWIGSRGKGIIRVDSSGDSVQRAQYSKFDERSLAKNFVLSLFRDRQDIIWCGLSGGGVAKYDPLKYQFTHIKNNPLNPYSLADNMVFDIFQASGGNRYIGTQNKGLIKWDTETGRFVEYPFFSRSGVPHNTVYDITQSKEQDMWVASWGGLIHFNMKSGLFSDKSDKSNLMTQNLYAVCKLNNSDSLLIAGQNGAGFYSLRDNEWKFGHMEWIARNGYIGRYVFEDAKGILWICTEGGGLVRFDYKNNSYHLVRSVKEISDNARFLLSDGNLFWIATDNGVLIYDHEQDKLKEHLVFDHISHSNVCYAIQKDREGYFWVSTNFGLVRIHPDNYSMKVFDAGDGFGFLEYNTACAFSEDDGALIFGGIGGMTSFNPEKLKANHFNPDPVLSSVTMDGTEYDITSDGEPEFNHQQNFFTFRFSANNFSNSEQNRYQYRMIGLSDLWHDLNNGHEVNFSSLPPGNYSFQVKAANSDGIWSEGNAEYSFKIAPPWWKSWGFLILLGLTLSGLVIFIIRLRIQAIRKKAGLRQRIVETEMMALRAQMNPHFIFNCLNSIDAFIQCNDRYQATVYLNKFARLLRNVLDSSNQSTVAFSRDFETLKLYIELEELRNEGKFITSLMADDVLMQGDFQVPPLVVQPFVENAILHGLKDKKNQEGKLKIIANKLEDQLRYLIEDNGVGRNGSIHKISKNNKVSYGMKMSRDRIQYFNEEDQASVIITDLTEDGSPVGTRIEVFLKLK